MSKGYNGDVHVGQSYRTGVGDRDKAMRGVGMTSYRVSSEAITEPLARCSSIVNLIELTTVMVDGQCDCCEQIFRAYMICRIVRVLRVLVATVRDLNLVQLGNSAGRPKGDSITG